MFLLVAAALLGYPVETQRADLTEPCTGRPARRVPVTLHVLAGTTFDGLQRAAYELRFHDLDLELAAVEYHAGVPYPSRRSARRRELARLAPSNGTVHVFAVPDVEGYVVHRGTPRARGLHWRYRGPDAGLRGRELILVAGDAPDTTLAHELGHLFGLRHNQAADNIMNPQRSDVLLRFDAAQAARMQRGMTKWAKRQRASDLARCGVPIPAPAML